MYVISQKSNYSFAHRPLSLVAIYRMTHNLSQQLYNRRFNEVSIAKILQIICRKNTYFLPQMLQSIYNLVIWKIGWVGLYKCLDGHCGPWLEREDYIKTWLWSLNNLRYLEKMKINYIRKLFGLKLSQEENLLISRK